MYYFKAIKKRVEALDREEKELDQRLKELQLKGLKAREKRWSYNSLAKFRLLRN